MKKRLTALMMAIMMVMSLTNLSACGREELAETHGIVTTVNTENDSHDHSTTSTNTLKAEASDVKSDELAKVEAEAEELRAELAAAEVDNADLTASNEELAKALEEAKKTAEANVADAQAEVTKLQKENTSLLKKITSYNELEAANKKLQKAYDELVNLQESGWVVIGDKAYCRYEYAVKRTLNKLPDGTWYHQAKSQVKEVVLYDDIIIGGNTMVYLDKTVEMARNGWQIAISFDGKEIYSASIGNYKWSENAAFQGGVLKTGYNLVETDKNGNLGRQDTIAQYIIGYVANDNAELGVEFYIKAGLYAANPVVKPACNHGQDCHCGNCDKCPALAPEKVTETKTETIYVDRCMTCGKTNCQGHVETETKTETIYVDRCMTCGKTNCQGHVDTETVTVKVCMICGKSNCQGHVDTETVTVKVCMICGKSDCQGHVDTETVTVKVCMICGKTDCQGHVDTETVTVKVCMICGKTDCDGHVETEKVYYCGKCGNLLEDCTCGDSDHNDLEDVEDPNPPVEPGHNDLEEVEDPNKQPSDSDHSNLGSTSNSGSDGNKNSGHNSTSSSSNKKSGHSALD